MPQKLCQRNFLARIMPARKLLVFFILILIFIDLRYNLESNLKEELKSNPGSIQANFLKHRFEDNRLESFEKEFKVNPGELSICWTLISRLNQSKQHPCQPKMGICAHHCDIFPDSGRFPKVKSLHSNKLRFGIRLAAS
jgi:hypothetical protein